MKTLLIAVSLAIATYANAQRVGIGTTTPHSSAKLDISANNGGILIPRLTTAQRNAISPAAAGLLVYDSDTNSFWFYTGTAWSNLSATINTWSTSGNGGTNPASNYIGTTDAMPLIFRVNNLLSGMIDSATSNTSFGYRAMPASTAIAGASNSAFGFKSMLSNSFSRYNTAMGSHSLMNNIFGEGNTAIGYLALSSNTTNFNTALGYYSMRLNTAGLYNTALGVQALYSNETGNNNTAAGLNALFANTSGFGNTAMGYESLYQSITGSSNTSIGEKALYVNTGDNNTALGVAALANKPGGNNNTAIGAFALAQLTGGTSNIALGYGSGTNTAAWNNTISIGNAGTANAFHNQTFIGNASTGWIGGFVGWSVFSDRRLKTNITEGVRGLDFITKLRPVLYSKNIKEIALTTGNKETDDFEGKYEVESTRYSGFIAQEVEDAAKQSNYNFSGIKKINGPDGFYTLSYESFVVPLVKAVQEQQKEIEELKKMIETLLKNQKVD